MNKFEWDKPVKEPARWTRWLLKVAAVWITTIIFIIAVA